MDSKLLCQIEARIKSLGNGASMVLSGKMLSAIKGTQGEYQAMAKRSPHTHGLVWLPELQMCASGLNVFEKCFTKATPKPTVLKKYSRLPDLLRNMMKNAK